MDGQLTINSTQYTTQATHRENTVRESITHAHATNTTRTTQVTKIYKLFGSVHHHHHPKYIISTLFIYTQLS